MSEQRGGRRGLTGSTGEELRVRISDRRLVAWFCHTLGPHWPKVAVSVLAMVLGTAADLYPPIVTKRIFDDVLTKGRHELLVPLAGILIGCFAASALFGAVRMAVMHILGQRMVYDLRREAHQHLHGLSLSYFEGTSTGDIMSRLSNDVGAVEDMVVHGTDTVITDAMRVIGTMGIMVYFAWKLSLLALLPLPFFVPAVLLFARRIRPYYRRVRDQLGEINAHLQENITGIRVVKAFAREGHEEELFDRESREYVRAAVRGIRMWATFFPVMGFVTALSVVAVTYFGARGVMLNAEGMTTGTIVMFLGYMMGFYGPVRNLMNVYNVINRALASLARIFELFDTQPQVEDRPDAQELPAIEGRVALEQVSFSYNGGEQVLAGVDISAEPGQTVAIVGRSGAGKTSIINLIPRFYDPSEGRVVVDGRDVRAVTQASLRRQTGMVLQDTFLFNDTVAGNIRYGRLDATEDEVIAAAKAANAHDFIMSDLPEGYDTQIGERGVKLSGGQKQRLAIARALLADPRILILDEATSSVDTEAEREIQAALEWLMRNRTTFVIAHRLSTIRNADQIVVLESGTIVERGRHQELMAANGLYREMYERQFQFDEPEPSPPPHGSEIASQQAGPWAPGPVPLPVGEGGP